MDRPIPFGGVGQAGGGVARDWPNAYLGGRRMHSLREQAMLYDMWRSMLRAIAPTDACPEGTHGTSAARCSSRAQCAGRTSAK